VYLQPYCPQGQLSLQLLGHGIVEAGGDVGQEVETPQVVLDEWEHVLHRLDLRHAGAVLAHDHRHVHALGF
jgi:hypothetical protein